MLSCPSLQRSAQEVCHSWLCFQNRIVKVACSSLEGTTSKSVMTMTPSMHVRKMQTSRYVSSLMASACRCPVPSRLRRATEAMITVILMIWSDLPTPSAPFPRYRNLPLLHMFHGPRTGKYIHLRASHPKVTRRALAY